MSDEERKMDTWWRYNIRKKIVFTKKNNMEKKKVSKSIICYREYHLLLHRMSDGTTKIINLDLTQIFEYYHDYFFGIWYKK